jgi:diadenosine tetraphosphate (Ap4A) HIT family hydrolase
VSEACVFCEIVRGRQPASIVWEDDLVLAVVDLRQFHSGHTLVMPRAHLGDVRELDYATGAALMALVACVLRTPAANRGPTAENLPVHGEIARPAHPGRLCSFAQRAPRLR